MKLLVNNAHLVGKVVSLCFMAVTCAGISQIKQHCDSEILALPILKSDTSVVRNFYVDAYCSETKIRTGVAKLSWNADKFIFERQRLDVTTYKNGFEKGFYTILCPLEEGQTFQEAGAAHLPDRKDKQKLFLTVQNVVVDSSNNVITLEIEGLEPGLTYFWRVLTFQQKGWSASESKRIMAPVCPADGIKDIQ